MKKKEIFEKIKKIAKENPKKITIVILIVFLVSLGSLSLYLFLKPIILRTNLATDDILYNKVSDEVIFSDHLIVGCLDSEYYGCQLRFNFTDKPNNWNKCVIRVYVFYIVRTNPMPFYNYVLRLNYNNWNENMSYEEFMDTWNNCGGCHTIDFNGSFNKRIDIKIGLLQIDISNYIENYETISLKFDTTYPSGFNYKWQSYFVILSKEAKVDRIYLPQIIWS